MGVLLDSDPQSLSAAVSAGDRAPSHPSGSPQAAAGSKGGETPVRALGWIAGILALVLVVSLGVLAKLEPRARYRRLALR